MAQSVGILAYGSLIAEPGREIAEVRSETRPDVMTPFPVEFARRSDKRGDAPTLVPYAAGAPVSAHILVLTTSVDDATDRLYRREINAVGSGRRYRHSDNPGPNTVVIRRLDGFSGLDVVLYTEIAANIDSLSAAELARLAIDSVPKADEGRDGISYLINAISYGIHTPLTTPYAEEINRRMRTVSLADALEKARVP